MKRFELSLPERLELEQTTSFAGVLLVIRLDNKEAGMDVTEATQLRDALTEYLEERGRA